MEKKDGGYAIDVINILRMIRMVKFKREDFKEFKTYTRCENCNEEIIFCDNCECCLGSVESVFCYNKPTEKGKFHICIECFEGEND
jgi:hypothetical protein